MFFNLSKILWFLVDPANVLIGLFALGTVLVFFRPPKAQRIGRAVLVGALLATVLIATVPFGRWMMVPLENRFPVPALTTPPKGIVIAGGVVNQFLTKERGQTVLGGAVERITVGAALAQQYPDATVIYSAGSGRLGRQDVKEADYVVPVFAQLGIPAARLVLENQSRNTFENATLSKEIAKPKPGETWVLVTSAFHMPRAVGAFRAVGWDVVAYPTDYGYPPAPKGGLGFAFQVGLNHLSTGIHEWLGLTFYWLTDRSSALFPAP